MLMWKTPKEKRFVLSHRQSPETGLEFMLGTDGFWQKSEKSAGRNMMEAVQKTELKTEQETKQQESLEELFQKLEEIAGCLEGENVNLEDSFRLYNEGMQLLKKCNDTIDKVEKKVLILDEEGETHEF